MNSRERFVNTMYYQPRDRVPWCEMGFWPETIEVWRQQGMPKTEHLNSYFGFDRVREQVNVSFGLVPGFDTETIEETETYRVVRRATGVVAKEFKGEHSFRMPQWLKFPLETRKDWEEEIKPRLDPKTPTRYPEYWEDQIALAKNRDYPLTLRAGSVFGWIRNWMGLEGISAALYDDPEWVQEMMDYVVDFCIATAEPVLRDIDLDYILLWEDMAYKAGPLISPRMFRRFMIEPYKRLTSAYREAGVDLLIVDSDGDSNSLIPLWIEGGVNGFYPMERAAGMDAVELRRTYGPELRLLGGIDKRAMIAGPEEIDAELKHVAPLCAEGGYMPWCDHHVPPDVPLEHYQYYVRRMKEMTLDPEGFVRGA